MAFAWKRFYGGPFASSLRAAEALAAVQQEQQQSSNNGNGNGKNNNNNNYRHSRKPGNNDDGSNALRHLQLPAVPKSAYKVLADKSGYVNSFRLYSILPWTQDLDVCVRYRYQIGEFVNEGTVLAYVWDLEPDADPTSIADRVLMMMNKNKKIWMIKEKNYNHQSSHERAAIATSTDHDRPKGTKAWENNVAESKLVELVAMGIIMSKVRSSDLHVTLGIQQLSDIAVRALSRAIYDPHTAIQCMDSLSDLLARLGVMELGVPSVTDRNGIVRACAPRRSFAFLLSLLDSIRRYGATDLTVC